MFDRKLYFVSLREKIQIYALFWFLKVIFSFLLRQKITKMFGESKNNLASIPNYILMTH